MKKFRPSFWDVLTTEHQYSGFRDCSIEQVKASVARDVEDLLNARVGSKSVPSDFPLVRLSVLNYGLTDFSALGLLSPGGRGVACLSIARTIEDHDGRLKNVVVSIKDGVAVGAKSSFSFAIHARLHLDPFIEHIQFDAVLDPISASYSVSRQS
jgi:type VI secretion system protein ImpF